MNLNPTEQCIRVATLTPDIYKVKYTQLIGGDALFCYSYCTVLKFEEETSEMLRLEHDSVWCWILDAPGNRSEMLGKF